MTEFYKRKTNTKCKVCGKKIYRRPVELKRNDGKVYCGQACYGFSCRKEKPCIICKKLILSCLHRITCSRRCSNIHRDGTKYKSGRVRDKVEELRAIKNRLLLIRGEKCERCDYNKSKILQVHHRDRNHNNNDFKNLELVCPNCHFEDHYLDK